MPSRSDRDPSWQRLYDLAVEQEGYFTAKNALSAGYSAQLLYHHVRMGRIERIARSIYRLAQYPRADHEELVVVWLWTDFQGVFSHETALALHDLSDALPSRIYVTLPAAWSTRRLRVPKGVTLYYSDVPKSDRAWFGALPITTPHRTIRDCEDVHVLPDLIAQAKRQAVARGLVSRAALAKRTRHARRKN